VCLPLGKLHGARRIQSRENFSELAPDDPHYRPSLNKRDALRKLRRIIDAAMGQLFCPTMDQMQRARQAVMSAAARAVADIRGGAA
jgi:hypothetical protein